MYRRMVASGLPWAIACNCVLAAVSLPALASNELEHTLRYQYDDKILVLRNFYQEELLNYDKAGSPTGVKAVSGDWTVDGFVHVKSLDVHGQRLTIRAERLSLGNRGQGFGWQEFFGQKKDQRQENKSETAERLRINIEFDSGGITSEGVIAALSHVFLTAQDHLPDLVPDYWKPCVLAASTGRGGIQGTGCRFPPEFATIPGVVYAPGEAVKSDEEAAGGAKATEGPKFRNGQGVSPPRVVSQTQPEFSEQARRARYQGTVVLSLFLDKEGRAKNIRVWKPLGFGLDQKAVETVSTWKFDPAKKDGEPVTVEIAIEVDFHLR